MRVLALVALCACDTSTPPAAIACDITLSGNLDASATMPSCASITQDDAGGSAFAIDTTTNALGHVKVAIDLGASASGTVSSETVRTWDVLEVALGDAGCAFAAGSDVVPHGTFALDWTNDDAGAPHGTLDVTAATHAAPGTACGVSDVEYIHVAF